MLAVDDRQNESDACSWNRGPSRDTVAPAAQSGAAVTERSIIMANQQSQALAERLEQGAQALAAFARTLSDEQWQSRVPKDGRKIGVVVHHVATMYPLEIQLAQVLAGGKPIEGVTWDAVHEINARHAADFDAVTKEAALELLRRNSDAAAAAIRALTEEQLQTAASISLYGDATLTCQFMLEDHAIRHAYHHLARIRAAVGEAAVAAGA
jgi:hypothetical protein